MTNRKKSKSTVNVGIYAGKQYHDVCNHEKQCHWQEENSPQGIKRMLKCLSHYKLERLVIEATGRYEFNLAEAAYNKGLPVCIVKHLSVRRYAGGIEQPVKTDKIDAAVIALFAIVIVQILEGNDEYMVVVPVYVLCSIWRHSVRRNAIQL